MTCDACGRELVEGDLFCGHCGIRLPGREQEPRRTAIPDRPDSRPSPTLLEADSVDRAQVRLPCTWCGNGQEMRAEATGYVCQACGVGHVLGACPACSRVAQIRDHKDRKFTCPYCLRVTQWNRWRSSSAKAAVRDLEVVESNLTDLKDPERRSMGFGVLGGAGLGLAAGVGVRAVFTSTTVTLYVEDRTIRIGWEDVTALEITGQGAVSAGGGFTGGGFGLEGMLKGALMAEALNRFTTKTVIDTVLRLGTRSGEVFLRDSMHTPDQLRILLSPGITRLSASLGGDGGLGRPDESDRRPDPAEGASP